jgi:hypothetical protein
MKMKIDGYNVDVNMELLAKTMAINHADWPAYKGKADKVAEALPEIIKIEKSLF